jgi:hypothetical protein
LSALGGSSVVILAEPIVPFALVWSEGLAVIGIGDLQLITLKSIMPLINIFFISGQFVFTDMIKDSGQRLL